MWCVLRNETNSDWEVFNDPKAILVARTLDDVEGVLKAAEAAAEQHRVVGYVAYEAAGAFDPALVAYRSHQPLAVFGVFDKVSALSPSDQDQAEAPRVLLKPKIEYSKYAQQIGRVKKALQAGDSYQVNLTYPLSGQFEGDPLQILLKMYEAQPTPFAALCCFEDSAIVSVSPELFFRLEGNHIATEPMKGTAARFLEPAADQQSQEQLVCSAKDRAENLMITDMIRNDLGRICEPGSIRVEDLFQVQALPTVWQQTSKVQGRTQAGFYQIMAALFPCASITGAPKPQTMAIIHDLETGPRGVYTGAIGILRSPRQMQFSVAIRTLTLSKSANSASYGVGGGIVWDSQAELEWEETKQKTAVLNGVAPALIETMHFDPEEGVALWPFHLNRLKRSAKDLGFAFSQGQATEIVKQFHHPQRVKLRLLLARSGNLALESSPLPEVNGPVKLALADAPVPDEDLRFRHKTTARSGYVQLRGARSDIDDVILWDQRELVIESSIYNIWIGQGSVLKTPRLERSGLPGVYRDYLLHSGKGEIADITVSDLKAADQIFVSNAVRGLLPATLISAEPQSDRL